MGKEINFIIFCAICVVFLGCKSFNNQINLNEEMLELGNRYSFRSAKHHQCFSKDTKGNLKINPQYKLKAEDVVQAIASSGNEISKVTMEFSEDIFENGSKQVDLFEHVYVAKFKVRTLFETSKTIFSFENGENIVLKFNGNIPSNNYLDGNYPSFKNLIEDLDLSPHELSLLKIKIVPSELNWLKPNDEITISRTYSQNVLQRDRFFKSDIPYKRRINGNGRVEIFPISQVSNLSNDYADRQKNNNTAQYIASSIENQNSKLSVWQLNKKYSKILNSEAISDFLSVIATEGDSKNSYKEYVNRNLMINKGFVPFKSDNLKKELIRYSIEGPKPVWYLSVCGNKSLEMPIVNGESIWDGIIRYYREKLYKEPFWTRSSIRKGGINVLVIPSTDFGEYEERVPFRISNDFANEENLLKQVLILPYDKIVLQHTWYK